MGCVPANGKKLMRKFSVLENRETILPFVNNNTIAKFYNSLILEKLVPYFTDASLIADASK